MTEDKATRQTKGRALPRRDRRLALADAKLPPVSVPYGCLVPRTVDGLLVAGRHVSCDAASHSFMREIPQCWLTGQAAGAAAGVSVARNVAPRAVPMAEVQVELLRQGAWVRLGHADERRSTAAPAKQDA
jgi:hypothetical protein